MIELMNFDIFHTTIDANNFALMLLRDSVLLNPEEEVQIKFFFFVGKECMDFKIAYHLQCPSIFKYLCRCWSRLEDEFTRVVTIHGKIVEHFACSLNEY